MKQNDVKYMGASNEEEEFLPVKKAPRYHVSNLGRVFRLEVSDRTGKLIAREKQPTLNKKGYKVISLYRGSKLGQSTEYVHRLVAELHVDNPEGKNTVRFKTKNKKNVKASNLMWS